jgi:HlyD family secretion protein
MSNKSVKKIIIVVIIALVIISFFVIFWLLNKNSEPLWQTVPVEKGEIAVQITATGTINPLLKVQVGTQVSGTIAQLFADFNSNVKKGQIIAKLDTTFLYAAVLDAKATCEKAEAQKKLATQNCIRTRMLFEKGLVSQAELDGAQTDSALTEASLSSAKAQLERAKINLKYATIISPITGVVINRNVDVGQTVAASFNTPTLFTIANDLTQMQVMANIDEADIGQLSIGQIAHFTVDAYPSRNYEGKVSQIRLQPVTIENVVTYTVMIDVNNSDLSLLPGMTANITIDIKKVSGVLKIPNQAFKFKIPEETKKNKLTKKNNYNNIISKREKDSINFIPKENKENLRPIYILINQKPQKLIVKTGLSNSKYTQVEGKIKEGDLVIIGMINKKNKKSSQPSNLPLGSGMPQLR